MIEVHRAAVVDIIISKHTSNNRRLYQ